MQLEFYLDSAPRPAEIYIKFQGMSYSDHHQPRPSDATKQRKPPDKPHTAPPGVVPAQPAKSGTKFRPPRTIRGCALMLDEFAKELPCYAVHLDNEDSLRKIAADAHILGQWAKKAIARLPAWRANAGRATSPFPEPPEPKFAQPPPKPAAPPPERPPSPPDIAPLVLSPTVLALCLPDPAPRPVSPDQTELLTPRATPAPLPIPPQTQPASSTRLIVRYPGILAPPFRPHPTSIVQNVNTQLKRDMLAAISYSRDDQLILHTKHPFTAHDLLTRSTALRRALDPLLFPGASQPPSPVYDTGQPWSKLVLHGVPLPVWQPTSTVQDQLRTLSADLCSLNSLSCDNIRLLRPLCSRADEERTFRSSTKRSPCLVSILVCTTDNDAATRLLRNGAVIQNAFCRATAYRPRPPRRAATAA